MITNTIDSYRAALNQNRCLAAAAMLPALNANEYVYCLTFQHCTGLKSVSLFWPGI